MDIPTESAPSRHERIWQVVAAIPHGKVATYGQVASLAGMPNQARLVGRVLSRLPAGTQLPWHRVLNAAGRISNPNAVRQQERLAEEGLTFVQGRLNLKECQWQP